ncbi:YheC/YheD family protein [Ferviditalea candida]|uniref:YheC/YheD family protein n=1 Tax=Ferviditalea candida TaxID=3108399 RepID=A0ABU5ZHE6_9BACL|nr:YheC/YheD family protein [Paenibacillaceae bacterium T2]
MAKWPLHRFFYKQPEFREYLPPTALFNRETLRAFLSQYPEVYIKANLEHAGRGIIKVWKHGEGYEFVKIRGRKTCADSIDQLYAKLRAVIKPGVRHVIQKGIDLAEVDGRRYDIRVMMMRNGKGKWEYTGMVAKVAGPGSVITNVGRGRGYAVEIERALRNSAFDKAADIEKLKRELVDLSYRISSRCDQFRYTPELGIDYGIDRNGRIWIIEINFDYPSHALFNKLKDKTMYQKIRATASAYRSWKKQRGRKNSH